VNPTVLLIPPEGVEVTVQTLRASSIAKLLPEIVTFVPTRAGFAAEPGVKVIFGFTVRMAQAWSPVFPVTVILYAAAGVSGILMTKEPLMCPEDGTEHDQLWIGLVAFVVPIVHPESPGLKLRPVTEILSPPLPLFGLRIMVGKVVAANVVIA
jgi:hypothetical protein